MSLVTGTALCPAQEIRFAPSGRPHGRAYKLSPCLSLVPSHCGSAQFSHAGQPLPLSALRSPAPKSGPWDQSCGLGRSRMDPGARTLPLGLPGAPRPWPRVLDLEGPSGALLEGKQLGWQLNRA